MEKKILINDYQAKILFKKINYLLGVLVFEKPIQNRLDDYKIV